MNGHFSACGIRGTNKAIIGLKFSVARSERLHDSALGAEAAEAPDAGLLPDHVVAQPRHRSD